MAEEGGGVKHNTVYEINMQFRSVLNRRRCAKGDNPRRDASKRIVRVSPLRFTLSRVISRDSSTTQQLPDATQLLATGTRTLTDNARRRPLWECRE